MRIQLPPKRWEDASEPRFDPIRHQSWFHKLEKRKKHIPLLKQAHAMFLQIGEHTTQKFICHSWGVSEREFRDYISFTARMPMNVLPHEQAYIDAINHAYHYYCEGNACHSFRTHLKACSAQFGLNPRALVERWEVDPTFYPTGYVK